MLQYWEEKNIRNSVNNHTDHGTYKMDFGKTSKCFFFLFLFFCFCFCFFFGLFRSSSMAFGSSWARVESELQLLTYTTATAMPNPSYICGIHLTHGSAGFLTHWARPGIEPVSSWVLVGFVTAEPWWELWLPSLMRDEGEGEIGRHLAWKVDIILLMCIYIYDT